MSSLFRPLALAVVLALLGVVGAASPVREQAPPDVVSQPVASLRYVALGDSYTAAPLVPPMSMAGGCLRSQANYPALVAAAVPGTDLVDRSCSGADTSHLLGRQDTGESSVPPQLDALTPATQLVTLGIGGHDLDLFGTLMGTCTHLREQDPAGSLLCGRIGRAPQCTVSDQCREGQRYGIVDPVLIDADLLGWTSQERLNGVQTRTLRAPSSRRTGAVAARLPG